MPATHRLEAIGQLAAGIAHEINTPIHYIGDNVRFLMDAFGDVRAALESAQKLLAAAKSGSITAELIAEADRSLGQADLGYLSEEIPKAIEQSREGVRRVATIVRAMKEFAHPAGEEKEAVDINRAIENTITVARNEWKYVADVVTDFDPWLPPVPCLPGEINQVILNLIVNAAHAIADKLGHATEAKGTITVKTRHADGWVEVRITDTGCGIPESARSKIFTPFFTTKPPGKGTGQGLALAHAVVVQRHGGTIEFDSEPGRGTTFIVRLPASERCGAGFRTCQRPDEEGSCRPEQVGAVPAARCTRAGTAKTCSGLRDSCSFPTLPGEVGCRADETPRLEVCPTPSKLQACPTAAEEQPA
jgi:signal transduction histidine kinase